NQEHRDLMLEQLGEALLDPRGDLVVAVAGGVTAVRPDKGIEDRRRHPGDIVAPEVHGASPFRPDRRYLQTGPAARTQFRCTARAIRGPLCDPSAGGEKGAKFRARIGATACVAGQNLAWSHRTAMLSQLRNRVPGGRNRPTARRGASHDGAQARLS